MPWVRIDEHFYDHPRWCDAPGDSIALWVGLMAWCNRNDSRKGFIPAQKTVGIVNVRSLKKTLEDLVERGAVDRVSGGYLIHDYEEYQQPEKVREIAAKRAASGKKGAAVRWEEHRRAKAHAEAPPHTDEDADRAIANDMANAMPIAMAKTCPDTDTDTECLNGCTDTPLQQTVPRPVDRRNGAHADPHPIAATLANLTRARGMKNQ